MTHSSSGAGHSGYAREQNNPPHDHAWIVDVATRRVVRRHCPACALEAAEASRLELQAAGSGLEGSEAMKVLKQIEEALEQGAEVLEPAESDLRVVLPDETHEAPPAHHHGGKTPIPAGVEVRPSPRELGREHRGY